jgi:hypothetical protein
MFVRFRGITMVTLFPHDTKVIICQPLTLADAEKKKYFKIQASSQAPASSAYSSRDVKRRKIKAERSAAQARETASHKDRIRRSKVLGAPLAGGFLERECGYGDLGTCSARNFVKSGYFANCDCFTIRETLFLSQSFQK